MRTRALHRALVTLLSASAVTALVPAVASAAGPDQCMISRTGYTSDLRPGQHLASGASLIPTPGKAELVMQPDGNLVIYASGNPGGYRLALWSSGTYGNPGAYATMQEDGNFVVYKKDGGEGKGGALWNTATYGDRANSYVNASIRDDGNFVVSGRGENLSWRTETMRWNAKVCSGDMSWSPGFWAESATVWLVLQKDNNLVMYRKSDGKAIWGSGTYGNRKALTLEMGDNGDLTLHEYGQNETVRWRTGTAGHTNAYALLQDDGNLVVYKKGGGEGKGGALWNTGTYNKV
ncbi:hypothetical protein [Streptomyces sp. NPDC051567]|uniref:hypothetical protein n=1 Tax=Streptomyces sp. NPDC051567 TaxID=3365660 RepID=UPI003789A065